MGPATADDEVPTGTAPCDRAATASTGALPDARHPDGAGTGWFRSRELVGEHVDP